MRHANQVTTAEEAEPEGVDVTPDRTPVSKQKEDKRKERIANRAEDEEATKTEAAEEATQRH